MRKKIAVILLTTTFVVVGGCGEKKTDESETVEIQETTVPESDEIVVDSEANEAVEEYVVGTAEDFEVTYFDVDSIEIIEYLGDAKYLKVPEEINGKKVATICGFIDNDNLVGVKLPESLKIIRNRAFDDCSSLVSVELGNSVESIEDYAFCNCWELTSINLPDSICEIGEMVFAATKMAEVHIPSGLNELKYATLSNGKLEEITVPNNIKKIGEQVFECDRNLKKAVIENGVEEIGYNAFVDCDSLEELHIPASVTTFGEDRIVDPNDNLTIYAPAGSAAETYANDNDINFVAE